MTEVAPVLFILTITLVAVEAWWIWFMYPHDWYLNSGGFAFLEILTTGCLVLSFFSFAGKFPRNFIFFAPVIPAVACFTVRNLYKLFEDRYEGKKMKTEIDMLIRNAGKFGNGYTFEQIGDIYFSRRDFENALSWYLKASSAQESTEISHKINITRQEILLKKKKLWICPECSMTNSTNSGSCKSCGALRPSIKTLKHEVQRTTPYLRKYLFVFAWLFLFISFFTWFIKNANFFTSFIVFFVLFVILALYFLYRLFSN
ncbi:MAG TPA: zinc finger Ran-binding domain-containing protein [bacterium]|nr:zinc finger Ran-binding domain-containing protein [bacterium]HOL49402.1 zinc finger Ran-binding domain-containing protein [bacterium]HPO52331.1 zinc finger Ran-binding domain-containing protein [bacterium]